VGLAAKGICDYISLSRVIVHFQVIILDQFQPSSLSHVQIGLGEDVLQTLVVCKDIVVTTYEVVPPDLQGMDHCCKLQIMGRVVNFMRSESSVSIGNYSIGLHGTQPSSVPDASQKTSKDWVWSG
jgi:hypothetical protein